MRESEAMQFFSGSQTKTEQPCYHTLLGTLLKHEHANCFPAPTTTLPSDTYFHTHTHSPVHHTQ